MKDGVACDKIVVEYISEAVVSSSNLGAKRMHPEWLSSRHS